MSSVEPSLSRVSVAGECCRALPGDVGLERPATERRALVLDVPAGGLELGLGRGGVELCLLLGQHRGPVGLQCRRRGLRRLLERAARGVRVTGLLLQLLVKCLGTRLGGEGGSGRLLLRAA